MAQHRRKKEWRALLTAYANRTVTQEEFCRKHGISVGALSYHLRKVAESGKPASEVIELKAPEVTSEPFLPLDLLELNCHIPDVGPIMIRTKVKSLEAVIEQLRSTGGNH